MPKIRRRFHGFRKKLNKIIPKFFVNLSRRPRFMRDSSMKKKVKKKCLLCLKSEIRNIYLLSVDYDEKIKIKRFIL